MAKPSTASSYALFLTLFATNFLEFIALFAVATAYRPPPVVRLAKHDYGYSDHQEQDDERHPQPAARLAAE